MQPLPVVEDRLPWFPLALEDQSFWLQLALEDQSVWLQLSLEDQLVWLQLVSEVQQLALKAHQPEVEEHCHPIYPSLAVQQD